jgi:carboxymethylenebutenolidase
MIITTEFIDLPVDGSPMRLFVASPKAEGRYPGVVFYSDIFQLTGPMLRITRRLAGYGFTVIAPEIYHRIEPPGTVLDFELDRARALDDSSKIPTHQFDVDIRAALDYLKTHPQVAPESLAAAGFCFGGHLAFRAALLPDVKATTCFYGTGIHNGKLGSDPADSLGRASEIQGKLLMVFGTLDPHIPEEGREVIDEALKAASIDYEIKLYPAEHTFMRDEGARHDPEATDQAFGAMIEMFRHVFA